jgi:cytochrome c oxidase cbb3-type subunit 1
VLVYWAALTVGGVIQGLNMLDPNLDFTEVVLGTIPYLEIRTYAGIAMTAGHLVFALSLGILLLRRKQLVEAPLFEQQDTGTGRQSGSSRQPEAAGTA